MSFRDRANRVMRILLLVACGAVLPAGSCASDIRDNMVKGGLDFVKSYTGSIINSLIPNVNEFFPSVPEK